MEQTPERNCYQSIFVRLFFQSQLLLVLFVVLVFIIILMFQRWCDVQDKIRFKKRSVLSFSLAHMCRWYIGVIRSRMIKNFLTWIGFQKSSQEWISQHCNNYGVITVSTRVCKLTDLAKNLFQLINSSFIKNCQHQNYL